MLSRQKLVMLATTTVPRHFQIANAITLLIHSVFLDVWWKKQAAADSAGIVQLFAFSTCVGVFGFLIALTLLLKRVARLVPTMMKVGMDGLVATFCIACGSVTAAFLSAARFEGNDHFCYVSPAGVSYAGFTVVKWGKCEMVQFALTVNTVLFFLCFLVSITLVSSTLRAKTVVKQEEHGSIEDGGCAGRVEMTSACGQK